MPLSLVRVTISQSRIRPARIAFYHKDALLLRTPSTLVPMFLLRAKKKSSADVGISPQCGVLADVSCGSSSGLPFFF